MSLWRVIQIAGTYHPPEFTHLQTLTVPLITKNKKLEMTNRDSYTHAMYLPNFKLLYFAL